MKWEAKKSKGPNIGDSREVKQFLFFPKRIGTQWRWLEKSLIKQILHDYTALDPCGGFSYDSYKWYNVEWLN